MMVKVFVFAIFAMSLNLIWGYTGLISLGHAAYFGVAGYTVGILILRYGIESFWLVAPAGILMATLMAAIFGVFVLRVSGIYFLLVTLAFGELLYSVAIKWRAVTGGSDGLPGIPLPQVGFPLLSMNATYFCYFVLLAFVISFFLLYRIINSPFGQALQGIRESEARMRSLGYNTWLFKYVAFVIAGLFAGVAGVLFVYSHGMIAPVHLSATTSTIVVLVVVIGSSRVIFGPAIGAGVVVLLEYFASIYSPERWPLILGGVFVISVMFLRGGVSIYLLKAWKKVRQRYGSA